MSFKDRSVLLVIGGGIAAYKCLELIRLLRKREIGVSPILTASAHQFVTPLSVASLAGEKVHEELFSLSDETEMGHIELSRASDLIVVAPATAYLMAKMANGLADDLASTALLATDKPVIIAPAMNVRMWTHAATQRNIATLKQDGVTIIGPAEGEMACGEFGPGRMAEPSEIYEEIIARFVGKSGLLKGRKVVITAGPTREAIDPVRYITNHSSGKQGYALAEAAVDLGAQTVLISGPVDRPPPAGLKHIAAETAQQMLEACEREMPCDIGIFAAAVADWRVAEPAPEKIKKANGAPNSLQLIENPDIVKTIAGLGELRPTLVVGFAAETENLLEHARRKLEAKGCDLIVANDVSPASGVMGGDRNTVHLVSRAGVEDWPEMSKTQVAKRLLETLAAKFQ